MTFPRPAVYRPHPVDDSEWVLSREDIEPLDGTSRRGSWTAPHLDWIRSTDWGTRRHASDFPWLGSDALVLTKSALRSVGDILERYGELLPVRAPRDLVIFNATTLVDALDADRSSLVLFPSSGRVMTIEAYEFLPDRVLGLSMFKIPQIHLLFVTDDFVERVRAAGLRGLEFERVWIG